MKGQNKLFNLLICLLAILLLYPFFVGKDLAGKVFALFFTLVLVFSIYAVSDNSRIKRILGIIFAVPTSILLWTEQFKDIYIVGLLFLVFMVLFCFFVVYCIVDHLLKSKKVTTSILAGAASAYLLIGISWGMLFMLVETVKPGSFLAPSILQKEIAGSWPIYNYFSFTTLTTLGYGDVVPKSIHAQSLASLEAVIGVLFTALLISRLVGMYLYQLREGKD